MIFSYKNKTSIRSKLFIDLIYLKKENDDYLLLLNNTILINIIVDMELIKIIKCIKKINAVILINKTNALIKYY
ncbi:hypothetical protein BpHYR1_015269 [Brachionus plicatilis]|uniref:Uncharacterized protein n=1 Tax=Brachionus plicatilis TaxID=10195 RepID=A0A3M7P5F3_BRAPC|nr:hypothetical protein BpHYR1_015269 [Brachionus plicatilis]